jgi:hypothetical protein
MGKMFCYTTGGGGRKEERKKERKKEKTIKGNEQEPVSQCSSFAMSFSWVTSCTDRNIFQRLSLSQSLALEKTSGAMFMQSKY